MTNSNRSERFFKEQDRFTFGTNKSCVLFMVLVCKMMMQSTNLQKASINLELTHFCVQHLPPTNINKSNSTTLCHLLNQCCQLCTNQDQTRRHSNTFESINVEELVPLFLIILIVRPSFKIMMSQFCIFSCPCRRKKNGRCLHCQSLEDLFKEIHGDHHQNDEVDDSSTFP